VSGDCGAALRHSPSHPCAPQSDLHHYMLPPTGNILFLLYASLALYAHEVFRTEIKGDTHTHTQTFIGMRSEAASCGCRNLWFTFHEGGQRNNAQCIASLKGDDSGYRTRPINVAVSMMVNGGSAFENKSVRALDVTRGSLHVSSER
jgi:hypothetical protein